MNRYDTFSRQPMCINCGHTLCRDCAKSVLKYGKLKCPFDNQMFDVQNVDKLGKNFTLLDLLEQES
jgi:RING-type zinc-finger